MERNAARALLYRLLALPLYEPQAEEWEAIASGEWQSLLREAVGALGLGVALPPSLDACAVDALRAEYACAFQGARPLRPVESLYKPWTTDPTAQLPIARETGWLGGDAAAHLRLVYKAADIQIPRGLNHAPDHLALELEFLALLLEQGLPEQADLFRAQHLDWLDQLAAGALRREAPPFYQGLLALIRDCVAADGAPLHPLPISSVPVRVQ